MINPRLPILSNNGEFLLFCKITLHSNALHNSMIAVISVSLLSILMERKPISIFWHMFLKPVTLHKSFAFSYNGSQIAPLDSEDTSFMQKRKKKRHSVEQILIVRRI